MKSTRGNITVRAGRIALRILRDEGLDRSRIRILAGASGGPKWLVLSGIDRVLPEFFRGRKEPLSAIGSSIGAWRHTALAQKNPCDAVAIFEEAYIHQKYRDKPTAAEVTEESYRIIDAILGKKGATDALSHPYMRLHILAVRSRGLGKSENPVVLGAGLAAAAAMNLVSRRALALFFGRALFHDSRVKDPFPGIADFDTTRIPLNEKNYKSAVMASGSIPLVMQGITGIDSAPAGMYRDGGIIDYHPVLPFTEREDDLVLFPHFYDRITPGWFDKALPWRTPDTRNMDNVVLISPSHEFVDSLPLKKIPDRDDFHHFMGKDEERIACWKEIAKGSRALGEEFMDVVTSGRIKEIVKPL